MNETHTAIILMVIVEVVQLLMICSLFFRKVYLYWTCKLSFSDERMKQIDQTANDFWSFLK